MRLVNIGLGNVNSTVGAFAANTDRCLEQAHAMAASGVTVGLFPEQVIGGYPPEDLIQWQGFVERQWDQLERFARETADLAMVSVIGVAIAHQGLRYNCAAVVASGQILGLVPKEKLPTYSIYYDGRTMARGKAGAVLHDPTEIAERVLRMAGDQAVVSASGKLIRMPIDTICVHGDTPGAVGIARRVRASLEAGGFTLAPFAKTLKR